MGRAALYFALGVLWLAGVAAGWYAGRLQGAREAAPGYARCAVVSLTRDGGERRMDEKLKPYAEQGYRLTANQPGPGSRASSGVQDESRLLTLCR